MGSQRETSRVLWGAEIYESGRCDGESTSRDTMAAQGRDTPESLRGLIPGRSTRENVKRVVVGTRERSEVPVACEGLTRSNQTSGGCDGA